MTGVQIPAGAFFRNDHDEDARMLEEPCGRGAESRGARRPRRAERGDPVAAGSLRGQRVIANFARSVYPSLVKNRVQDVERKSFKMNC